MFIILIIIITTAIIWRAGGNGNSLLRNPGVPILIGLTKASMISNFWALLYIPAMWAMIQAISYGVTSPPHKLCVWIVGKLNGKYYNAYWRGMADNGQITGVEITTRSLCGFCWAIPSVVFAIISGSWIGFALYVAFLTVANGLIGGLIEDVEISERAVGACVSTSVII